MYLQPRVGEEFEATISTALEFGLFVQLKEMPVAVTVALKPPMPNRVMIPHLEQWNG